MSLIHFIVFSYIYFLEYSLGGKALMCLVLFGWWYIYFVGLEPATYRAQWVWHDNILNYLPKKTSGQKFEFASKSFKITDNNIYIFHLHEIYDKCSTNEKYMGCI